MFFSSCSSNRCLVQENNKNSKCQSVPFNLQCFSQSLLQNISSPVKLMRAASEVGVKVSGVSPGPQWIWKTFLRFILNVARLLYQTISKTCWIMLKLYFHKAETFFFNLFFFLSSWKVHTLKIQGSQLVYCIDRMDKSVRSCLHAPPSRFSKHSVIIFQKVC